nr:aminotransferase class IV [uncultured Porphyromonas sp.]
MPTQDLHPSLRPCRYLETLGLRGGQPHALELHRDRVRRTLLHAGAAPEGHPLLEELVPERLVARLRAELGASYRAEQLYRLSYSYDREGVQELRCLAYAPRQLERLILWELPEGFDYSYKYADRSFFDAVQAELQQGELPLFVRSEGSLSDTSYTNIVLWTAAGYRTPERPLLEGTERRRLLEAGQISTAPLSVADLSACRGVYLINAMMPLESAPLLPPPELVIRRV